ncbi:MAG TPA: hypothetical protein VFA22_02275 [Stellaceae bacterium]|nr:hypothetical protein [Stellaceae bacterium]
MNSLRVLVVLLATASCSLVQLTDPYGNVYGGWYDHGQNYRWQLATCEQEIVERNPPNAARKQYMRCCMWRHGVPIDDAAACGAATG